MEQNNIEQNQIQPPVEGVKKQNNNIGLIVMLVLIIIALVGYVIYTKLSENTETPVVNNNVSTKNDDIKNEFGEEIFKLKACMKLEVITKKKLFYSFFFIHLSNF